jgi:hypothetical protein
LGYYRHPTEPGVVMLMVSEGVDLTDPGVVGSLMKVVLGNTPAGPIARCLWQSGAWGKPVPHFAEDVDGDGVADILVSGDVGGGWPDRWDLLVSGSDGRRLAEFGTELVAVEQKPSGPRRLAVKYVRSEDDFPIARLLTYSTDKAGFVTSTTQADEKAYREKAEGEHPGLETMEAEAEGGGGLADASRAEEDCRACQEARAVGIRDGREVLDRPKL